MRIILRARSWYLFFFLLISGVAVFAVLNKTNNQNENLVTATVERGEIRELVSISGFIEAKNTADLAFPASGKVTEVFVDEGSIVENGEVLATLATGELVADRAEALATLRLSQAQLDETTAGLTTEEKSVISTKVNNAEQNLDRVSSEQAEKVTNARVALLSTGLEALSTDPEEMATAPTITGTYNCLLEGEYKINTYRSGAASGYTYRLSGLGEGTQHVFTDQPSSLDGCGLFVQFDASSQYSSTEWIISIPNTRSNSYVTNLNAYELALEQQENAIAAAEDALTLALEEATEANASARNEIVGQKRAGVDQARARIAAIDARIADRSIVAPFAGEITGVDVLPGETVTSIPVITILAEDAFELTARVPEIDITKIITGQKVETVFDAKTDETLYGTITYISPLATEIDGVAYFETTVVLEGQPDWIRSGLNADIDIVVGTKEDALKLPKRLVTTENGVNTVSLLENGEIKTKTVEVVFTGNDGYVAITGLNEGDVVVAP